nr:hypothetical protein [uncultured Carboxylicivirga sp.]
MKNTPNPAFIIRTTAMTTLVILVAVFTYLFYYVLIFNDSCAGKVYGDHLSIGGKYKIHSLKYYYKHNGTTYFDTKDEIMLDELEIGDTIKVSALSFYPGKHRITEINRDLSHTSTYNAEDGFYTEYHMHINHFCDYFGPNNQEYTSDDGQLFYYSASDVKPAVELMGAILDKVKFNQGSLIEKSIIRQNKDSIIVKQIYYYLNNFSLDAEPLKVIKQEMQKAFPNQTIVCSVLDNSNPKHERFLK